MIIFNGYAQVNSDLVSAEQLAYQLEQLWPSDLKSSGQTLIRYLSVLVNEAIYAKQTPPVQHTFLSLRDKDRFAPFARAKYWMLHNYYENTQSIYLEDYKDDSVIMETAARQLILFAASKFASVGFSTDQREEINKTGRKFCLQAIVNMNESMPGFRIKLDVLRVVRAQFHRIPRILFELEHSLRDSILPAPPPSTCRSLVIASR